jgi:hypothetical protein
MKNSGFFIVLAFAIVLLETGVFGKGMSKISKKIA